jgi:YD repeat-containing protein
MGHHVAEALTVLGEAELAEGDAAGAVAHLREAVGVWRTRGWLSFQADALAVLGQALSDTDPGGARDAYDEAGRLYEQTGATAKATTAAAAAARLGSRAS